MGYFVLRVELYSLSLNVCVCMVLQTLNLNSAINAEVWGGGGKTLKFGMEAQTNLPGFIVFRFFVTIVFFIF